MKLSIIGIGQVGAALAYGLLLKEMVHELVLVHHRPEIAEANARDLRHAGLYIHHRIEVRAGSIEDTANSDLVVITAAAPWKDSFNDRLDAAAKNTELFAELIPPLAKVSPNGKFLVISNPVDILTYHTIKLSGLDPHQVLGTGTLVDSGRFRSLLAADTGIHPVDIRAYILGEHGNSQFPVFSVAEAGGEKVDDNESRRAMAEQAASAGVEVFKAKGNTNFAVSTASMYVIDSILNDARHTMPVSVYLDDYHGVRDLCMSVPAVVGCMGVNRLLQVELTEPELAAFHKSADIIHKVIQHTKKIYT